MISRFLVGILVGIEGTEKTIAEGAIFRDGVVSLHYIGTQTTLIFGSAEELEQSLAKSNVIIERLDDFDVEERPRD